MPNKLRYRGWVYRLVTHNSQVHKAETDVGRAWRIEIVPKLEKCLEIASDEDRSDYEKHSAFAPVWADLRIELKRLGL